MNELKPSNHVLRSESSIDLFMSKLEHRLPEVRARAADSLASAASLGLLPARQLADRLRALLRVPDWAGRSEALELLRQLRLGDSDLEVPEGSDGGSLSHVRGDVAASGDDVIPRPQHSADWPPTEVWGRLRLSEAGDYDGPNNALFSADDNDTTLEVRLTELTDAAEGSSSVRHRSGDGSEIVEHLPWQAVASSDLHVLTSTATSLTSADGATVRQALTFLCDVTLQDFPAEVFLQRPALLQAVFHVLVSADEAETDVILACVRCLTSLAERLLRRFDVISSADTRQPREVCAPSPPTEGEAAAALSLPTFCGQLLSQAVSCLYVRHWAALQSAARLGATVCQLARRCVPATLWTRRGGAADEPARAALTKALKVFHEVLLWHRKCYVAGDSVRLHRCAWLTAAAMLADAWHALRPPDACWAARRGLLAAPVHLLFDELLFAQQPALHGRLLALCADDGCATLWRRLGRLRRAMEAARGGGAGLQEAAVAAECVELHGGAAVAERAVAAACGADDADAAVAARLLLRLLTARAPAVRATAYRRAAAAARAALRDAGRRAVPALLQPDLLELALDDGLCDSQTETDATDLVLYTVTAEAWVPELRPHLVAALPLLLCHVTRPQLTRPISHVVGLCGPEDLRGDLILTTHENRACREDAWSRIISRLSAQNSNAAMLPELSQLGDLDLSQLMLVDDPPPVISRRGEVNDVLTLTALLPLAWCGSASLDVRRATLSQVALLLQDADLHRAFLDHDGLSQLLRIVTRATMREPDLTHDVSLLPDCVAILRLLALFSASCRHHLGDDSHLQLLMVRVLLMFRLDISVRQSAAQLLLAVGLDSTLICQRSHDHTWHVTVPQVMTSALRLPFILTPRKRRRLGRHPEELPEMVLTEPVTVAGQRVSCGGLLRTAWSLAWHNSLGPQPVHQEYSDQLRLPDWQLAAAGAGQLELAASEALQQLETVSSHTAARVLLSQLSCYVSLHGRVTNSDRWPDQGVFSDAAAGRWLSVLKRHLLASPSTEPDRRVLAASLRLLLLHPAHSQLPDRAVSLLAEHSRLFTETLLSSTEDHPPAHRQTALTALHLLVELCLRPGAAAASLLDTLTERVVAAAARVDSAQPDSLVRVQRYAALLQTALLSPHQLASCLLPAVRLLRHLCPVLPADAAPRTCMASGVLAAAALCLQAVTDQQDEWTDDWADCWRADVPDGGQLLWLGALWHHHHLQIRWGGLAAVHGLTRWPMGAVLVTQQLQHLPGGVWGSALGVLLAADEAPAVREQAALLLASLTSHLMADESGQISGPEVSHIDAEVCLTGAAGLVTLIEHADWYERLSGLLEQLHGRPASDQSQVCTPALAAAALRFTHNVAVLSPVDVAGRLCDVIHALIQWSGRLDGEAGWADGRSDGAASCWVEALRLCTAAVLLEPEHGDGRHLLLTDCRLLRAAAATVLSSADADLRSGLLSLLLALLAADEQRALAATGDLLGSWPDLWHTLPTAPPLLAALLSLEAGRQLQLAPGRPPLLGLEAAGGALCAALLARPAPRRPPLAALLLVSAAAKAEALRRRLHRRVGEELRERIAALVTGSLSVRAAAGKGKERTLLAAVLGDLDLLRNLMSGSTEVKQALAAEGLPNLLHKLWPWCVTSRQLTVTVLCTLNTLAAGCVDGARGLAYTSAALHQGPSSSPSSSSLVHLVLDDCQRHLSERRADGGAVQRLAVGFSLLAAAALVQEGRSIICRSTFLHGFRFGGAGRPVGGGQQRRQLSVTRLWLLLIKNVTFFEEGQKVVAQIPEVIGSLVALLAQDDLSLRSSAVLVLRNLSYLTAMQTALLNTDGFVSGLTSALRSGHPVASCAAVALCWQLLANSRKARTLLTSAGHLESLQSAIGALGGTTDEETATVLARVTELLKQPAAPPGGQLAIHG